MDKLVLFPFCRNRITKKPEKFLGIDHGTARIGLSWGDELGIALPLAPLVHREEEERWRALREVIESRKPDCLVVGLPLGTDGGEGQQARIVRTFGDRLSEATGIPVEYVDERHSSQRAEKLLGRNLKRAREERKGGRLDSASAATILQDYLDTRFP